MTTCSQYRCPLCSSLSAHNELRAYGRQYLRCSGCTLVFMHSDFRLSAVEELARYQLHQNSRSDSGYCQHLLRAITPLTSVVPSGCGVDFGCGPNPTASELLREMGYTVANYDPFFVPDERILEQQYDFVLCTEVAEHFQSPLDEFERLHRMLKPGGWLSLMTKLLAPEQSLERWWYAKDPTHVSLYSRHALDWIERRWRWSMHFPSEDVYLFQRSSDFTP